MESMVDKGFWKGKKVFITGHTGFKGSWLCLWLHSLEADITGYSLPPPTDPCLYSLCRIDELLPSFTEDIRDGGKLKQALVSAQPEIVFHLAAQPIVRESYKNPAETYGINIMGTVNLLEAVRACPAVRAAVNVTSDKCYENRECFTGYSENDSLSGYDPYSGSKACSEIVTSSYRNSFFNIKNYDVHRVGLATARAGNVIGGGDWSCDRLIPDCIRALMANHEILLRNPDAVRPWQHVLEPLGGYMLLAQRLYENGRMYSQAWNFGPDGNEPRTVEWIVKKLCGKWGGPSTYRVVEEKHLHETSYLKLDCVKAKKALGWYPRWDEERALDKTIEWYKAYREAGDLRSACYGQIEEYSGEAVLPG